QVGKALGGNAAFGKRGATIAEPDFTGPDVTAPDVTKPGFTEPGFTEPDSAEPGAADGSIMIVLATDAPLSDRNLERLATRGFAGLARTGAAMSDGSGDYAVAFSTAPEVRRRVRSTAANPRPRAILDLPNDAI